jgi:glycine hydroxymethyltransferase
MSAVPAFTGQAPSPFVKARLNEDLASADPEIDRAVGAEFRRQQEHIELIASENIVSRAVMEAQGTILTNKYAEGYPGKRYYGGCEHVDLVEELARERAKALFNCAYVNVQPHSGSQANQAVFMSLAKPGDTILGMSLDAGGHLTHGAKPNLSGKWFNAVQFGVRKEDARVDFDQVRDLARKHRPAIIIAGFTAYPPIVDFKTFREIADEVGAYLHADMSHFAGLVAGDVYPNPLDHAHVAITTTHKTLRGPRGGMILTNDADIAKKVNSSIFPGLQGGPLPHVMAAKAVAFHEALRPEFKAYASQVVRNAQTLARVLQEGGLDIVSGGTETHMTLVDLRPKGVTGKAAESALERANITCNKNNVPFDTAPPAVTSGVRLGSPAGTTRGYDEATFADVARLIVEVLDGLATADGESNPKVEAEVRDKVLTLNERFPIYR